MKEDLSESSIQPKNRVITQYQVIALVKPNYSNNHKVIDQGGKIVMSDQGKQEHKKKILFCKEFAVRI